MVHKGLRRHHSFCKDYVGQSFPGCGATTGGGKNFGMVRLCRHFPWRGGAQARVYTLREVEKALKETGRAVHVIAPQRQQV